MTKRFALLALTAALLSGTAGAAAAQQVRLGLEGKDPETIRAEVRAAAREVCQQAYPAPADAPRFHRCVDDTVRSTHRRIGRAMAEAWVSASLASATSSDAPRGAAPR